MSAKIIGMAESHLASPAIDLPRATRRSRAARCPAWAKTRHLKVVVRESDDNRSEVQGGNREVSLEEARIKRHDPQEHE